MSEEDNQDSTPVEAGFGADTSLEPKVETVEPDGKPVEAEAKESEGDSPPPVEEDDKEKTNPFKERIDKLTSRYRETERALTDLESENEQLRKQVADIRVEPEPVKTLADFEYDEAKYRQYIVDDTRKIAREEAQAVARDFQKNAARGEVQSEYDKRESTFAESVTDFKAKVYDDGLKISQSMAEVIRSTDIGPELAYHLAGMPDEASRIARLSPVAAGMEMATMIGELRSEIAKSKEKSVSKAPPPPGKIKAGSDAGMKVSTTDPKSDKMSDAEWFKAEELRTAKQRM